MQPLKHITYFCLCVLLCVRGLAAQTVTGTITGTVVDPGGSVIPGAAVTLLNERTRETRLATTGDNGVLTFVALQPGSYTVTAERSGFKAFERTGIRLSANERLALGDISLSIGSVSETVTVSAQGAAVQT